MQKNKIFTEGIYGIDKMKGVTSFDVVGFLRRKTGIRKIGHAGTLDPLATGVLIVAVGKKNTKRISEFVKQEKEYEAEICLDSFSKTDDDEGEKEKVEIKEIPDLVEVKNVCEKFIGEIEQTPPLYSAIKINGKPAYKYARKGKELKLKPRKVMIKEIEILGYEFPILKVKVICGSGTYIRSLARDIGKELKTGGYIKNLCRTRIGDFEVEDCEKLEMEIRSR